MGTKDKVLDIVLGCFAERVSIIKKENNRNFSEHFPKNMILHKIFNKNKEKDGKLRRGAPKVRKTSARDTKSERKEPKVSQRASKVSQKGAQREPKGGKREPKGAKREPK